MVVLAATCAGLHIWDLPAAIPSVRHDLAMTLVQTGALLGVVQLAGMLGGLAVSLLAELAAGERRCVCCGWVVTVLTLASLPLAAAVLPAGQSRGAGSAAAAARRISATVRSPRPWIAGLAFACLTIQWMTVVGFLPTIYAQNGLRGIWPGVLTAVVGGLGAGRLDRHRPSPAARRPRPRPADPRLRSDGRHLRADLRRQRPPPTSARQRLRDSPHTPDSTRLPAHPHRASATHITRLCDVGSPSRA